MKSYVLTFLLILLVVVAGCGAGTDAQQEETTGISDSTSEEKSMETESYITVEEVTAVETVEEDLSLNDDEDDYGDII
jgi:ABC-type Fe3+-citrate transport system substrate-binding protein